MPNSPTQTPSNRVTVLIDGYNLYHAIDDLKRDDLKWLDLRALSNLLITPSVGATVTDVLYFSAYATWKKDQYARHQVYVKALTTANVRVILGNFKRKDRSCNNCGSSWIAHEEKETDVNISIRLIDMTYKDAYDRVLLVSGDTDLAPALRMVKQIAPRKQITLVLPPRRQSVGALINASDNKLSISADMLKRCQFPHEIIGKNGIRIVRPTKYDPVIGGTATNPIAANTASMPATLAKP